MMLPHDPDPADVPHRIQGPQTSQDPNTKLSDCAPTQTAGLTGVAAPSPPSGARGPATPMTAFELEQLRDEWRRHIDLIDEALEQGDLVTAVRLNRDCRRLDRVIYSQPLAFITGGGR